MAAERPRRLLTGDRPTGRGHLGHYVGAWQKKVSLQEEYECFFLVADLHVMTTRVGNLGDVGNDVRDLVLDYLSVGIDPERSTIYLQSLVPEVLELQWVFMSLVSVPRAQRIPTLKEQVRDLQLETASMALLAYPILQAADILMVKGEAVPVGKDQLSHIELTREIARRFNDTFAPVFPVPEAVVGEVPMLPGIDGTAKMGKSLGNAIFLSDDEATVTAKVMRMYTDPTRIHATDPGHVKGNPVFIYHDAFNPDREEVEDLKRRYRRGRVGDVEVKQRLARSLNSFLAPIRERRHQFESQRGLVEEILMQGTRRARVECHRTLEEAREAMGLTYFRGLARLDAGSPGR